MNGDQAAVIEGSTLQEGYKYLSKELCPYQNIFQFPPDAWFLSMINYPTTAEHWMLIGMHHAKSKTYFIYDPQVDKGQKASVEQALVNYIDCEARAFVGSSGVEITTLGSGMTWN